jgi:hypothetical protein
LGGLSIVASKYVTKNKTASKLTAAILIFIALTFGVSLIWMIDLAPYFGNALLGLMFTGLVSYLFFRTQ